MSRKKASELEKAQKYIKLETSSLKINPNNKLVCNPCKEELNVSRKSIITAHLECVKHKDNLLKNNIQPAIKPLVCKKDEIILKGFIEANIPLYKLRHNSIKIMFSDLNIQPPSETSVRRKLNDEFSNHMYKLKKFFKDKYIFLMVDEAHYNNSKYFNIIMGDVENPDMSYLVECVVVPKSIDSEKVKNYIDDVLKDFSISRDKFILLLSDAARYMTSAAKKLAMFYENLLHVTCVIHLLHNCCMMIKNFFPNTNFLISNMKNLYIKNNSRKNYFKEKLGKLPEPIVTRFGTWLEAALFYAKNFDDVKELVECLEDEGLLVEKAKNIFKVEDLHNELTEIAFCYDALYLEINNICNEGFKIADVKELIQRFNFRDDPVKINDYIEKRLKNTDLQKILKNETIHSPFIRSRILICPGTTILIERSFSMLNKVLTKERDFNDENVKKYVILYYNNKRIKFE